MDFITSSWIVIWVFCVRLHNGDWVSDKIVGNIIDKAPPYKLQITYGVVKKVDMGNELTPTGTRHLPTVIKWKADYDTRYVFLMTDPDYPSSTNPKLKEWGHWLVGNIQGAEMDSGESIFDYVPPCPPNRTGFHRYVFLLFKQPKQLIFDEPRLFNNSAKGRVKFSTRDFASKYELGDPIAGNYFRAKYDNYVIKIYRQMKIPMPKP